MVPSLTGKLFLCLGTHHSVLDHPNPLNLDLNHSLCCGGSINPHLFKENTRPECPVNLIGNQSH